MGLGLEYYYMSNWNHSLWIPCSEISHARSMHPNPVVRSTIPQQVNQDINKKLINFSVHWNYVTKIVIGNVGCNLTIIKHLVVMHGLWISCLILSVGNYSGPSLDDVVTAHEKCNKRRRESKYAGNSILLNKKERSKRSLIGTSYADAVRKRGTVLQK